MEIQGQIRKFIPKIVTDPPVADEIETAEEYGGANLEMIYRDLYNFQMCEYCGIPTNKNYCSESCFVANMKSS